MQAIRTHWDASFTSGKPGEPLNPERHKRFYEQAKHNLRFFTFHASTPSALVSREMQSAFFNCGIEGQFFPIITRVGIKSALDVRMPDPTYSKFLPELPVFPDELVDGSESVITALRERGMLRDITFTDVLEGLQGQPLSEVEMAAFLQWWIDTSQEDPTGANDSGQLLLGAAVLAIGLSNNGDSKKIPLVGICTFLNPKSFAIPTDGPFPDHMLPISVSWKLNSTQLQNSLQWRELTVLEWVQHIVDPVVYSQRREFNITKSLGWADCVLQVLGRCWSTLPELSRSTIVRLLDSLTCIPTSAGMKMPREAYFPSAAFAAAFPNLPVVNFPSMVQIRNGLEGMLTDLGIRKHVELNIIFDQ